MTTKERGASLNPGRLAAGTVVVIAAMAVMLLVPPSSFVSAAFVATTGMVLVSVALGGYRQLFRPSVKAAAAGLAVASLLYLLFIAGGLGIAAFHPLGMGTANENSIYSLIASPGNPLYVQVLVLVFDAVGYESFFRGVLQRRMQPRLGTKAPFAVAGIDAAIHILSLNPLWVASTLIVDSAWGLNYRRTDDLTGNIASHLVWDVLIFVLFPIR